MEGWRLCGWKLHEVARDRVQRRAFVLLHSTGILVASKVRFLGLDRHKMCLIYRGDWLTECHYNSIVMQIVEADLLL
jgi:hypothetical protein